LPKTRGALQATNLGTRACVRVQLLGVAVFTSTSLDVELPSLVWKRLLFTEVDEADLEVRGRARTERGWGPTMGALGTSPFTHSTRTPQAIDLRFVQTTLTTLRGAAP
jgi:hypothetical protein